EHEPVLVGVGRGVLLPRLALVAGDVQQEARDLLPPLQLDGHGDTKDALVGDPDVIGRLAGDQHQASERQRTHVVYSPRTICAEKWVSGKYRSCRQKS